MSKNKLKIRVYPDEILRQKSEYVTSFDEELKTLANDMLDSLEGFRGVGLSAVQVGILLRLFVVDTKKKGERCIFVNPEIVASSEDNVDFDEGCLSVPSFYADVKRPSSITVQAYNIEGKIFRLTAHGLYARAIQHEMDHLNGVLFIDKISQKEREKLLREYNKKNKSN